MTTQKQAAANKSNALKSTGAKTPAGKLAVSGNAIKHGILSSRILLGGEDAALFGQLRDEMELSLRPVGMLEAVLVEKIAAAIWKQRRLVEAETASIELGRDMSLRKNRQSVDAALGGYGDSSSVTIEDLADITADDRAQVKWCHAVIAEFNALDEDVLEANELEGFEKAAPLLAAEFNREAEEECETPANYLLILANNDSDLGTWSREMVEWCEQEIKKHDRRPMVQAVANLVRSKLSAPVEMEVLARYQVALDGELYRAMGQLRKQQEWRMKAAIDVSPDTEE